MKGKSNTETILKVMHVLAWIAFVGFCIEGGAMLVAYTVSLFRPAAASDLYQGMDLSQVQEYRFLHYTYVVSVLVGMEAAKAYASFLVIKILSKLNLSQPFDEALARRIERVSYVVLGMGVMVFLGNTMAEWLEHRGVSVPMEEGVGGFLFLAGIIFIFAQIFKRGVAMQAENELTI